MKRPVTTRCDIRMWWGHDECPSTAQLVYSGRAGGPHYTQSGGSSNPQCLPLDPNFLMPISGGMYGTEYETNTDSNSLVHGHNEDDVPCAVCHVSNHTAVYSITVMFMDHAESIRAT